MSSRPDVRSRKNAGNGSSTYVYSGTQVSPYRQSSDGADGKARKGDYILLHRPDRISQFFKSWRHWWKGDVEASDRMKPRKERMKWRYVLSQGFLDMLWLFSGLLAFIGKCVEYPGNILRANGGFWQSTKRLFGGGLIVPRKDDPRYLTLISQLDPRTKLWVDKSAAGQSQSESATSTIFPGTDAGARSTGDVLVMASKLAYENEAVIKEVVTKDWNMHFVGFYNCWNEFLKQKNTQVFIFADKEVDANAIVIAWRGTEAFNAKDWSTDFDFSWYHLEGMGNVHVGFLEALGLANRDNVKSFQTMQQKADDKWNNTRQQGSSTSGLDPNVIEDNNKLLAYDDVTSVVRGLLAKHPSAKIYVTGHSLGGALAALYTGMLYYNGETEIVPKVAAVYTFGQPRVGDEKFAKYMTEKLTDSRYFRVVYCNDLVPRIPFDDELFAFKHFGLCFYYNSQYKGRCLVEAPRKNYFYLSDLLMVHVTAVGELINAFRPVDPEYAESWSSIMARVMALFVPGIGGHSPVNYVNAVRLGPSPLVAKVSEEIQELDENLHNWEEKMRTTVSGWWSRAFQSRRSVTPA
ncbi:hypothetical protein KC19_9G146700 [Ceratodon purpureus]|uniref:Fungal lipase-type domain-containing protein n=1 Tax=Ceratodon purpureus TaxID=3225 RepID=A0A8T0GU54_CERPU|nr:hypothetical protein KC19_9G146700 [Ceratodon purpureus]